jgi:hypothetical protein
MQPTQLHHLVGWEVMDSRMLYLELYLEITAEVAVEVQILLHLAGEDLLEV